MASTLPMAVIIHKEGNTIYSFDNFKANNNSINLNYQEFLYTDNGFHINRNLGKCYVYSSVCNRIGWVITVITDYSSYEINKRNMLRVSMLLVLCAFVIELIGSFLITRTITEQLSQLRDYVKMLRENKTVSEILFTGKDEVSLIGNEFINVVNENKRLIGNLYEAKFREKEAELISLQTQINPHFLYNTLDTIFWMAIDSQNQQIADVIVSLSKLFRLSLNKGEQVSDIASEIELIRHYIHIQNTRYDNRFSVNYRIPDELYPCKIIKFMLQPIVENSVYHGLEKKSGEGSIDINAYCENGFLYLIVTDDGVGFECKSKDILKSGYALRNIQKRILLYYGEECGLSFRSSIGTGCEVSIKIRPNFSEDDLKKINL